MSADNGIIIRRHPISGKILVQTYFASYEYPYVDDCRPEMAFDTVEDAIYAAEAMEQDYPSEYGIYTQLLPGTRP